VARYPYLGSAARIYTQYADITGGGSQPLHAVPGSSYDMIPGPGQSGDLPVPPGDGLWGPAADVIAAPAAGGEATVSAQPVTPVKSGKGGDR
jgi:hypothetical protein